MDPSRDAPQGQLHDAQKAAVQIRGLTKTYRSEARTKKALAGVELDIARGEMVAVLGKSGSGKTTLLNILGGLDSDYIGQVHVGGCPLHEQKSKQLAAYRQQHVGFVFQHFVLRPDLNCLENVTLPALLAGRDETEAQIEATQLLKAVGLGDLLLEDPMKMSGGQRQRIAIARALLGRPSLLLCDEPTGALDERTGMRIMQLLCELQKQIGFASVVVSHEQSVAAMAQRQIWLQGGKLGSEQAFNESTAAQEMATQGKLLPSKEEAQKLLQTAIDKQRNHRRAQRPRKWLLRLFSSAMLVTATVAVIRFATLPPPWRWLVILGIAVLSSALLRRLKRLQSNPTPSETENLSKAGTEAADHNPTPPTNPAVEASPAVPASNDKGE